MRCGGLIRGEAVHLLDTDSSKVKRPPSDFELLKAIYKRHRNEFGVRGRSAVVLAIDIPAIAKDLKTEPDIVFGRLYHHLDPLYGEAKRDDGQPRKALFMARVGEETSCVNFPMLEAVLAGLWQERNRQLWAVWASALSVSIAVAALIVSIVTATKPARRAIVCLSGNDRQRRRPRRGEDDRARGGMARRI